MVRALADAFGAYDAVAGPTIGTVTYPIGKPFDKTYTQYSGTPDLISPGNLAGVPAIALPNGFGENGLPTSITLQGTAFQRNAAHRDRQALPDADRVPPAPPAVGGQIPGVIAAAAVVGVLTVLRAYAAVQRAVERPTKRTTGRGVCTPRSATPIIRRWSRG